MDASVAGGLTPEPLFDAEQLADTWWLALCMAEREGVPRVVDRRAAPPDSEIANKSGQSQGGGSQPETSRKPPPITESGRTRDNKGTVDISTRGDPAGAASARQVADVRITAASDLPERIALGKALRPLMRRVPGRREREMDVERTVQRFTEEGVASPVFRPKPDRWLDLVLILDASPTMAPWMETARELMAFLERHGAFRDVQAYSLGPAGEGIGEVRLHRGLPTLSGMGRVCGSRELLDPGGQRALLIMTDGIGNCWRTGHAARLLADWSQTHPAAILQMLPETLWIRTPPGAPVRFWRFPAPGALNRTLLPHRSVPAWEREGALPVPMIALSEESLRDWAKALAARRESQTPGVLLAIPEETIPTISDLSAAVPPDPSATKLETQALEDAALLYARFSEWASPEARALLLYLTAVPLTLPVMRLMQRAMLGARARQSQLAEVLSCGMLRRVSPVFTAPESARYEFLPGVRERLRSGWRKEEAERARAAISEYVADHLGGPRDFLAQAHLPDTADAGTLSEEVQAFARLALPVIERFLPPRQKAVPRHQHIEDWPPYLLWVDDSPEHRRDPARLLEQQGFNITFALSTDAAMDSVHNTKFSLIISDMKRPESKTAGMELLTRIREQMYHTPLIFFTRESTDQLRARAETFGVIGFAGKGASGELFSLVRRAFQQPDGFYSEAGIKYLVSERVEETPEEHVQQALLLFRTRKQRTWLVTTNRRLFCLLDSQKTRDKNQVIQWNMPLQNLPLTTRDRSERIGTIDLGRRVPWLYSKTLHPDPDALKARILEMIAPKPAQTYRQFVHTISSPDATDFLGLAILIYYEPGAFYLVTSYRVVVAAESAGGVEVDQLSPATLVSFDGDRDIAVLRVKWPNTIPLDRSEEIQVAGTGKAGDEVQIRTITGDVTGYMETAKQVRLAQLAYVRRRDDSFYRVWQFTPSGTTIGYLGAPLLDSEGSAIGMVVGITPGFAIDMRELLFVWPDAPPEIHRALSVQPEDTDSLALEDFSPETKRTLDLSLAVTSGPIPATSPFYVRREADGLLESDIRQRSVKQIFLRGEKNGGVTSLLNYAADIAMGNGMRVVRTNIGAMNPDDFGSLDTFYQVLCQDFIGHLELDNIRDGYWSVSAPADLNMWMFLQNEVLKRVLEPTVWIVADTDLLFYHSVGDRVLANEVFDMFRSWQKDASFDNRLRLLIECTINPEHLVAEDIRSLYHFANVIDLDDFTLLEMAELNDRYGAPLRTEQERERFHELFGGIPALSQVGLKAIVQERLPLHILESRALSGRAPFDEPLRDLLAPLERDPTARSAAVGMASGRPGPRNETYYRLQSFGIVSGRSPAEARIRCGLYRHWLSQNTGNLA